MPTKIFERTQAYGGEIKAEVRFFTSYTATGNINVIKVGFDQTPPFGYDEWRGYYSFNTNQGLPSGATLTKVEFKFDINTFTTDTPGEPADWRNTLAIGTFLDGGINTADWGAGTVAVEYDWPSGPADDEWVDLGGQGITGFNNSDYTDIEVIDTSLYTGSPAWSMTLERCQLRITYHFSKSPGKGRVAWTP